MVLKADCDDVREVLKDIYEQVYLCINPNFHYADVSLVYQLLTESYGIIISNSGGKLHHFISSRPKSYTQNYFVTISYRLL